MKWRHIFLNFSGIICYRLFLDLNYQDIISPLFGYDGYVNALTLSSYFCSWISLFIFIPLIIRLYQSQNSFFANVIVLLFLMAYVPSTSLIAFMPMDGMFVSLIISYWLLFMISVSWLKNKHLHHLSIKNGHYMFYLIMIVLILSIVYVSGVYTHFRISFDLINEYELRADSKHWNLPGILHYLIPAAGTILPMYLVYFLQRKKKFVVLILSIVILLNFSLGGHKTVLFLLLLCFWGYFFFTSKSIYKYSWFLTIITCISYFEYKIFSSFWGATLIIRRVLYVPAFLNYQYYDFFSVKEKDMWRTGILGRFGFESPYGQAKISHLIGEHMGYPEMGANNGLFSDAYANFGILGILFFPFLLVMYVKIMDSFAKGIDVNLLILPIIATVLGFISSFFTTLLLTHGLLVLLLLFAVFPNKIQNIYSNSL